MEAEVDSPTITLPPHLAVSFEQADAQLRTIYGVSPGVTMLIRLWLACATPFRLQQEFERAVMGDHEPTIRPNPNGTFDDDCL